MQHEGHDVVFNVAAQQRVIHLAADKRCPAPLLLHLQRRCRAPCRPIREPHVANLAGAHESVESLEGFLERRERIFTMHHVEINVVGLEPPETGLAGLHEIQSRQAGMGNRLAGSKPALAGQDQVVASSAKQFAQYLFCVAVVIGRVDEVDAGQERAVEHFRRARRSHHRRHGRCAALGEVAGAERSLGNDQAGIAEPCVLHFLSSIDHELIPCPRRRLQQLGHGRIRLDLLPHPMHQLLEQLAIARAAMSPDLHQQPV